MESLDVEDSSAEEFRNVFSFKELESSDACRVAKEHGLEVTEIARRFYNLFEGDWADGSVYKVDLRDKSVPLNACLNYARDSAAGAVVYYEVAKCGEVNFLLMRGPLFFPTGENLVRIGDVVVPVDRGNFSSQEIFLRARFYECWAKTFIQRHYAFIESLT